MKKVMVFVLVLTFLCVAGFAFAQEGEAKGASTTSSGPLLNNMANWITSHFPSWERSADTKEVAPPLSAEELKAKRENTGVGMRGIVGNEGHK